MSGWRARRRRAVLVAAELERGTGYAALEALRAAHVLSPGCPAIALSAKADPVSRLRTLQRGCVDFLALPVFYPELVARLQLAIARGRPATAAHRLPGGLEVNYAARTVCVHGQLVELSNLEFELLAALAREPHRVFTKLELLRDVWAYEAGPATRTLESHACRLRSKLRAAGGHYIANVRGVGYRLHREAAT